MNQEWNIKSCSDVCTKCQRKFADQEEFTSCLFFGEAGYTRDDLCKDCREKNTAGTPLSVWKTVYQVPPPGAEEPLKKETAESLLRELMETEDPAKRNVIYILAVMLERRRILVEKDVQVRADGVKIRVYEHKTTSESFTIPDPELKLRELEHVQREVMEMLGVPLPPGMDKPGAPAPETAGVAPPAES